MIEGKNYIPGAVYDYPFLSLFVRLICQEIRYCQSINVESP